MKYLTTETPAEGVAVLTVTAPEVNNHMTWAVVDELWRSTTAARENGARVIVLASGVDGHWFEHAWLRDLANGYQGKDVSGPPEGWFGMLKEFGTGSVVFIAAISGDTSGGGCEFGWACDLRVAEEQVLFSQPEVRIGVGTGIGGTSRLVRLIGKTVTAEMVLMGGPVTAQRIYDLGGINRVVPKGKALEVSIAWAKQMASYSPDALAGMKAMLNNSEEDFLWPAILKDQDIMQSFSGKPRAVQQMEDIQARFDAGENLRQVYFADEIPE